jgi:Zn finger protein HypA/HybF involved in hydrogenase expression
MLIKAIPNCESFAEVALELGMCRSVNTALRKRALELNLDFSHFRRSGFKAKPLHEIKHGNSHKIKLRLFRLGIFEKKCYKCNLTEWNGLEIPLELEHINGDHYDYHLENLTILCPNCHAQTDTYRAKNIGRYKQDNRE